MKVMTLVFSLILVLVCLASANLQSDIYGRVAKVYGSSTYFDAETLFAGVRGGDGLAGNVDTGKSFLELIPVVSNNYASVERNWNAYGTNEVVRFTVLSAVAFSGICVYTNFTAAMVARCEQGNDTNDWESVRFLVSPIMTPQERAMMLNYDRPPFNDLLSRIRACAMPQRRCNGGDVRRLHFGRSAQGIP